MGDKTVLLNDLIKIKKRTEYQIEDTKRRKEIDNQTHNRDLQQLHKDLERLDKMIENLNK
jgi:hypothetical protein